MIGALLYFFVENGRIMHISMSKKKGFRYSVIGLIVAILFTLGCERYNRPVGARKDHVKDESLVSDSTQIASVHAVPGIAGLAEVLPGGPQAVLDGAALYVSNCSACHQVTGQGLPSVFPPLAGSPYVTKNEERLAAIMIYGLMGEIKVLGNTYNSVMAPLGTLSDEELSAIAGYVRSSWGNDASPVVPEVFEQSRDKYGSRAMFNISELGEES